ncbi:Non-motile and phage-resistance protein [Pseudobythopirellula maris]|uniref:histidine kinase n=1 Tax=Pseudobythopirellula maris TaxID=2527991 RepID=A0A5C5ZV23_9BACT|nr:ATP-binding protein [Pseudobythopirellula maris]TWT90847.1 Non-motile and phage-resistance protein [Pseudobythopirellula maris]
MCRNENIRVLLLEDDHDFYRLIAHQLNNHRRRFELDRVETLAEAIDKLKLGGYHLVLSDLSVPDSSGFNTIESLRQVCALTPIIVFTGLDDDAIEQQLVEAGAQDYLVKGESNASSLARSIFHAVQRQEAKNRITGLVAQLQESQELLSEQTMLLQKKNRRLKKLYKTAQEFVDNVSHDLRTPLTVIKDYMNLIREGMVGEVNERQQEMLGKACVRADDLNHMVDDLLDVSKLDSGLLGAWRRPVALAKILDHAAATLKQRAEVRGTALEVDCEADLPLAFCDAEKAERVLTNLAVNAIKYSAPGSRVRLWARFDADRDEILVGVTDNGPGIHEDALQEIFERFNQSGGSTDSSGKSYGLGLSIAQRFCRMNLGVIDVESKAGEGSTFKFTLPTAEPTGVLQRWLDLSGVVGSPIRLIEIVAPPEAADQFAEYDGFLHGQLRRDDLLVENGPGRWLFVIGVAPSEAELWFERAQKDFKRMNRNRFAGPLAPYRTETIRTWEPSSGRETILEDFRDALCGAAAEAPSLSV